MRTPPRLAILPLLLLGSACAQEAQEREKQPPAAATRAGPSFMRFVDTGNFTGKLEVAHARYGDPARGIVVDLLSAVHVGETSYYADLTRRFATYDAVLYELVAPDGTVPDPANKPRGFNPISALQQAMQRMLQLEFQLEAIDYTAKNFVHADLSPDEIAERWRKRGKSLMTELLSMMSRSTKIQQERHNAALEAAEEKGETIENLELPRGREPKRRAMKWALARELGPMEEMLAMFGDDDKSSGSVLIGERNARAVAVAQRELAAGKKKLAIFYGAAHMPDMALRLERDLGLRRLSEEWVAAWTISETPATPASETPAQRDQSSDKKR